LSVSASGESVLGHVNATDVIQRNSPKAPLFQNGSGWRLAGLFLD